MIVFVSEKEIPFRILLIIVKKRGSGNSAVKFIRDETFPIQWMEDYRFLPILGLSPGYIQLLKLTRDFSHLKLEFCSKCVSNVDGILNFPRARNLQQRNNAIWSGK